MWWQDVNKPEQFGFASKHLFLDESSFSDDYTENQVTPFNFSTPDHEVLYAWHVMPLGLYAKHEAEILREPSGCAEDMTKTRAFKLMTKSPQMKLIINCEHEKSHQQSCQSTC